LISVVIATFRRCDVLKVTLERLTDQTASTDTFDVLVVDDGSPDGTAETVESLKARVPYELTYLWHENRGPGYTQNRGIREASGDLVLLMADDIWATPDLVERHLKAHAEYPQQYIAVLGKVLQSPEMPQTVVQRHWDPFHYDRLEGMQKLDGVHFFACNISIKKNFMLEHGLFRERAGAAHEDIELGYRLGQVGLEIIYDEKALAYHYHPETLEGICRRAYERGVNFDMLSGNVPEDYILPLYKVLSPRAGLKTFLKMLPREIPRTCVFNTVSVRYFWLPVLARAEKSGLAALFANEYTYRGLVGYHFRLGRKNKLAGRA
jgi:GT2 family glycosyltransferase